MSTEIRPVVGVPVIPDSAALVVALEARQIGLGLSDETVEKLGGFSPGTMTAIRTRGRRPSLAQLDALCELLAVSFVLVEDDGKRARNFARFEQLQAGGEARPARQFVLAEQGRRGAVVRWKGTTAEQRSAAARHAAEARWKAAARASHG
jgi:hypothetical protein